MISQKIQLTRPGVFQSKFEELDSRSNKILVKPKYLSICDADQRYYSGNRPAEILSKKLPMSLIHEAIGEVVYSRDRNLLPGDKVILLPLGKDYEEHANYRRSAFFRSSNQDGFLQELLALDSYEVLKFDSDPQKEKVYTFTEMISVCYQAIKKVGVKTAINDLEIGIWGDGVIGYLLSLVVRQVSPSTKISVIGKHLDKLSLFTHVDNTYLPNQQQLAKNFDLCFECVGGANSSMAINEAIDLLTPEGKIGLLGVSELPQSINTRLILEKGITIIGSSRSDRNDFINAKKFIDNLGDYSCLEKIISNEMTVSDLEDLKNCFDLDKLSPFKTLISLTI